MTHTKLSRDQIVELIKKDLFRFGISLEVFLASDLDDFQEADLRELWLLYHDVLVEKLSA